MRLVWVVSPKQAQIYVYKTSTAVRVLTLGEQSDEGMVLPGCRLALNQLFDPPAALAR